MDLHLIDAGKEVCQEHEYAANGPGATREAYRLLQRRGERGSGPPDSTRRSVMQWPIDTSALSITGSLPPEPVVDRQPLGLADDAGGVA